MVNESCSIITAESINAFISHQIKQGASDNMIRRFKAATKMLYDFLPEDKHITRERLLEWRTSMNENGYAYQTVQNYVKWINLYSSNPADKKMYKTELAAEDYVGRFAQCNKCKSVVAIVDAVCSLADDNKSFSSSAVAI